MILKRCLRELLPSALLLAAAATVGCGPSGTVPDSAEPDAPRSLQIRVERYRGQDPVLVLGHRFAQDPDWPGIVDRTFGEARPAFASEIGITIYHVNDLHSTVRRSVTLPMSGSEAPEKVNVNVLSVFAHVVRQEKERAEDEIVLFVTSGDDHIGSKYDVLYRAYTEQQPSLSLPYHYYSRAFMDAAAVGNHELDKGAGPFLSAMSRDARFPVLSANLTGDGFPVPSAAIREYQGLRVGFVGVTVHDEIYAHEVEGLEPLPRLREVVSALQAHVDFLVVLSHIGVRGREERVNDSEVARYLEGVEVPAVVIGGHTHEVYPRREDLRQPVELAGRVPTVQAGSQGLHLGKLTVTLDRASGETGRLALRSASSELIDPGWLYRELAESSGYRDEVEGRLDEGTESLLDAALGTVIGRLEKAVVSEFADDEIVHERYLDPSLAIARFMDNALVNNLCRSDQAGLREMIDCSSQGTSCRLVSAFNGSGINSLELEEVPESELELTVGTWYEVMPYADTIFVYKVPFAEFESLIAENAERFREHIGTDRDELPEYPKHDVLHFSDDVRPVVGPEGQVTYEIPFEVDEIVLLTTSYVAAGRGGWQAFFGPEGTLTPYLTHDTQLTYRKKIIEEILADPEISMADIGLDSEPGASPSCSR